jgi:glycosyltransferase involved in cell wall biosynthesis
MSPSLSIVIPVLNEEEEIVRILTGADTLLRQRDGDWEIIVVDNASTDQTCARVEPFLDDARFRLLRNDVNRGKGFSIRRGMLEANGDYRLMCDADCVTSLNSLSHLERALDEVDVAVGSRLSEGARVSRQQPVRRRIVGFGFLALTRIVMGPLPRDVYCGFKLWRGEVAQTVFERVHLDGWAFDAEALALARRLGFGVREVGIEWTNRPDSRLSIGNVLLPVVGELLAARRNVRRAAAAVRAGAEFSLSHRHGTPEPVPYRAADDARVWSLAEGQTDVRRDGLSR